ncbi:MAG TPA: hypothetical protein VMR34_04235 [Candidatus Saccharimonadales bacterium]|nr:hypothetical protein [Candidatus Saccharimonadales bacterium]
MAKNQLNGKRGKIDQANSFMVIIIAVSSFLVVFSLTSAKALISQYAYQERVISAQQRTITQIKTDLNAVSSLVTSYEAFANTSTNIIGGNPSGTGPRDGNNAKIVLDALPTEYDFPAMVTEIQSLISNLGVTVGGISATNQSSTTAAGSLATPTAGSSTAPVDLPFSLSLEGTYGGIQNVINALQECIRPMQIISMSLSGSDTNMTASISAQTYYQPASGLKVSQETIK